MSGGWTRTWKSFTDSGTGKGHWPFVVAEIVRVRLLRAHAALTIGNLLDRFIFRIAQLFEVAFTTLWLACLAHTPPMPDDLVRK